ncbi:MAG: hypothetical protein LBE79_08660 [Tannerella sp.]|jgi:hypothetical protein|nr:hypothetical protein [Tannerella sp.]
MKRYYLIFLILTLMGCEKIPVNPVYGPVNLGLNLLFREKALRGIPSYQIYSLSKPGIDFNPQLNERIGLGGLVVVHTPFDTWAAFDLACPNEQTPNRNTLVEIIDGGSHAICAQCGTKYQILDGTGIAIEGKKFGLRSYHVSVSGNTGMVTN